MRSTTPIPKNVKAAIGEVILQGSYIDSYVTAAIIKMIDIDTFNGMIMLNKVAFKQKINKLQYLVEADGNVDIAEKYDEISKMIEKFLSIRNTLAHGCYSHTEVHASTENDYYFMDMSDYGVIDESFTVKFAIYKREELWRAVALGSIICGLLRELFEVIPLHEVSPEKVHPTKPPTPRSLRKSGIAKR